MNYLAYAGERNDFELRGADFGHLHPDLPSPADDRDHRTLNAVIAMVNSSHRPLTSVIIVLNLILTALTSVTALLILVISC